jgi:hypothetical protein
LDDGLGAGDDFGQCRADAPVRDNVDAFTCDETSAGVTLKPVAQRLREELSL